MKYLYTVLDRKKQGNSSVYLVKNLKTNEEKVLPIDWIRKEHPKGRISNISISESGKITIIKDKNIESSIENLFKTVVIKQTLEDAYLDGLPFESKKDFEEKRIEILKDKFITSDLLKCLKIVPSSLKKLNNSKVGEIYFEKEVVGYYPDYSQSDYLGEEMGYVPYTTNMNEDTSLLFYVDETVLKGFVAKKNLMLNSAEIKRLSNAIIYSALYHLDRRLNDESDLIGYERNFRESNNDTFGNICDDFILEPLDVTPIFKVFYSVIKPYYEKYIGLVSDYVYTLYHSRVVKEKGRLMLEIYSYCGYLDFDQCMSYESYRFGPDDCDYDPYDD